MYKPRKSTRTEGEDARDGQAGASIQHQQQSARQSVSAGQRPTSGRPSQLQIALPNHHAPQNPGAERTTSASHPPQLKVALPGNPYNESTRSVHSDSPSRTQVVVQGQCDMVPRRSGFGRSEMTQPNEYCLRSRPSSSMASIRGIQPSPYIMPSQQHRTTPPTEPRRDSREALRIPTIREPRQQQMPPTFHADRPQGGKTYVVQPGEPHHFGIRADYDRVEIISTLCRCNNPDSHGDAYTMLNSPRGRDINGQLIDWQEAKKRILNHYGRDQISRAEEIAAVPFVYDARGAQLVLQTEEELKQGIRDGHVIGVNTVQNNVDWHNSDRHAKPWLTLEGAKTQFGGGVGYSRNYGN